MSRVGEKANQALAAGPAVFVRHVSRLERGELVELVAHLLDDEWDAHPYLLAVFDTLARVDFQALEKVIAAQRERLHAKLDTWTLGGFTLATTRVGNRHVVDEWFAGWESREAVPMWLLAAYAASFMRVENDPWKKLIALSHRVLEKASPDSTRSFFETFVAIDLLATGKTDEFHARLTDLHAPLVAFVQSPRLDNPIVRYLNSVKHERPMLEDDFTFNYTARPTIEDVGPVPVQVATIMGIANFVTDTVESLHKPPDWRLVLLVQTIVHHCTRAAGVLWTFDEMIKLPKGHIRANELSDWMTQRPMYPMLKPLWGRLVRRRVSWWTRFKAHFKWHDM